MKQRDNTDETRANDHSVGRRTVLKSAGMVGLGGFGVWDRMPTANEPPTSMNDVLVGVPWTARDVRRTIERYLPTDAHVVRTNEILKYAVVRPPEPDTESATRQFMDTLATKPGIAYAELDGTVTPLFTPNDPFFDNNDPHQYVPQTVRAPAAWNTTFGSPDVTVAMLDRGVEYDHPDLAANVADDPGKDFTDAADGDPYIDENEEEHGTAVAGIMVAVTNNNRGIAGLSQSTLICGRVMNENGEERIGGFADAIQWAADRGADIINMSIGQNAGERTLRRAVAYAYREGALLVCSAGNANDADVRYPAVYPETIAVSALSRDGSFFPKSNSGPVVELTAPGEDVLTTGTGSSGSRYPDNTSLYIFSGTSASTPVVSGVAALALSRYDMTNVELRVHLRATAVDVGLPPEQQGHGRVDALNAVTTPPPQVPAVAPSGNPPSDPDGDGLYEDVNGNGGPDFDDVVILYKNRNDPAVENHAAAYDFNGNGEFEFDDIVDLYEEVQAAR